MGGGATLSSGGWRTRPSRTVGCGPSRQPLWHPKGTAWLHGRARRASIAAPTQQPPPSPPPPAAQRPSSAPHGPAALPILELTAVPIPDPPTARPIAAPTAAPPHGTPPGAQHCIHHRAHRAAPPPMAAGPIWHLSACRVGQGDVSSVPSWDGSLQCVPPPSGCPHISGCCAHGLGVSVRPLPCTGDGADPPPPPPPSSAPLRGGAPPSPPAPPRSQPSDAKQELPWQQVGEFQLLLQQQGQEGGNGGGGAHKRGGSRP